MRLEKTATQGTRSKTDFELLELSDAEFADHYLKQMKAYHRFDDGNKPNCTRCRKPINSVEEFRRYYGQDLHPACLKEAYEEDKANKWSIINENRRKLWERIIEIKL